MRKPDSIALHVIATTASSGRKLRPEWAGILALWYLRMSVAVFYRSALVRLEVL